MTWAPCKTLQGARRWPSMAWGKPPGTVGTARGAPSTASCGRLKSRMERSGRCGRFRSHRTDRSDTPSESTTLARSSGTSSTATTSTVVRRCCGRRGERSRSAFLGTARARRVPSTTWARWRAWSGSPATRAAQTRAGFSGLRTFQTARQGRRSTSVRCLPSTASTIAVKWWDRRKVEHSFGRLQLPTARAAL